MSQRTGVCGKCGVWKPPPEWGAHKSWCLACMRAATKDYRSQVGRDEFNRRQREWNAANPSRRAQYKRKAHLKSMYGLTEDELLDLLRKQGGRCGICQRSISYGGRNKGVAVVDHEHATGSVRGILCSECNFLLGKCNEDITILQQAIAYLRTHLTLRLA
jgi:hypothetical protein